MQSKTSSAPSLDKQVKIFSPNNRVIVGFGVIIIGCGLLIATFYPVLKEEVRYLANSRTHTSQDDITPVDTEFGIVIPKIRANARVIPNVDPYNAQEYQSKLTQGVAHASTSSFPNESGNMFIFAHSSDNFYNANRYNSVFYLLTKLEKDDEINIFYNDQEYVYKITSMRTISPKNVQHLYAGKGNKQTITLMTCWPPGTTINRFIVEGELVENDVMQTPDN